MYRVWRRRNYVLLRKAESRNYPERPVRFRYKNLIPFRNKAIFFTFVDQTREAKKKQSSKIPISHPRSTSFARSRRQSASTFYSSEKPAAMRTSFILSAAFTVFGLVQDGLAMPTLSSRSVLAKRGVKECDSDRDYSGPYQDGQGVYIESDQISHPYKFPKVRKCWHDYFAVEASVWCA